MTRLSNRVAKLEFKNGHDPMDRWLNSLTDEQLESRIAELDQSLRASLAAEGVDCSGMSAKEVCGIVSEFESNREHLPARFQVAS